VYDALDVEASERRFTPLSRCKVGDRSCGCQATPVRVPGATSVSKSIIAVPSQVSRRS
jgi:hypothetical protein